MTARKIIIDCDPGIDDALALVYAHGHPGLALAGLTTVAGNVSLDKTTANALRIREFLGLAGVPVVAGSQGPLLRSAIDARDVHGESGLGLVQLPEPVSGPAPDRPAEHDLCAVAQDAGPGIANLDTALEEGSTTYGGLGLGLPGCRRLMDQFEITSELGRGTTVTMTKWKRS